MIRTRSLLALIAMLFIPTLLRGEEHPKISVESIAGTGRCLAEQRVLEVSDGDSRFAIALPYLVRAPVLGWEGVCSLFLKALRATAEQSRLLNLEERAPSSASMHALSVETWHSRDLDSLCVEQGYCLRDLFDFWGISPSLKSCLPNLGIQAATRFLERQRRTTIQPLPHPSLDIFPWKSLTQSVKQSVQSSSSPLLVSTMSIGDGTARDLIGSLAHSGGRAIIAADAGIMFSTMAPGARRDLCNAPHLGVVPMTRDVKPWGHFHWKGGSAANSDDGFISGMNLSTAERNPFLDIIINFRGADTAAEWRGMLTDKIRAQCRYPERVACVATALGESKDECSESFGRACAIINAADTADHPRESRFFIRSDMDDPRFYLLTRIAAATSEIIVAAHELSDERVIAALVAAKKRGVRVAVLVGRRMSDQTGKEFSFFVDTSKDPDLPPIHFKIMIIDGNRLIFSTGNFSSTALDFSEEFTAEIADPQLIGDVIGILRGYGLAHPTTEGPSTRYLVSRSLFDFAAAARREPTWFSARRAIGQYTIAELTPVSRTALKSCGIEHTILRPAAVVSCSEERSKIGLGR